jgi:DNA-binding LytR/AlgR family response regulator
MNCIIIDDDNVTRTEVEHFIKAHPSLNLVASYPNAIQGFDGIAFEQIDLIFLDVMMPGMTGLELVNILPDDSLQVILMTTEKDYAVDAFNYSVTDFIVKPISLERFSKAVAKAEAIYNSRSGNTNLDHIFVKVNSILVKINTDEILYIESLGDYISIHTPTSRFVVHSTMKSMMAKLSPADFIRVHNSFIVRVDRISVIEDNSVIINEKTIPLSRLRRNELMAQLNLL